MLGSLLDADGYDSIVSIFRRLASFHTLALLPPRFDIYFWPTCSVGPSTWITYSILSGQPYGDTPTWCRSSVCTCPKLFVVGIL